MDFRLATMDDLPALKRVYQDIVDEMIRTDLTIWDDVYPCEFFADDIKQSRLYVLIAKNGDLVSAFALCASNSGVCYMNWETSCETAFYLERFGVNPQYCRQRIGQLMMGHATKLTKQFNGQYLRLFVADTNLPAITFYLKAGFTQVDGIYEEVIEDFVLREYGFELKV